MSAADRLDTLETLDATTLCERAESALNSLVDVMARETMHLHAGHIREAGALTAEKAQLAQDYVTVARAIQRSADRLRTEVPERIESLRRGHEALATQMAENLKVLATAKSVSESILLDVARQCGRDELPKVYDALGNPPQQAAPVYKGISVNRAS